MIDIFLSLYVGFFAFNVCPSPIVSICFVFFFRLERMRDAPLALNGRDRTANSNQRRNKFEWMETKGKERKRKATKGGTSRQWQLRRES